MNCVVQYTASQFIITIITNCFGVRSADEEQASRVGTRDALKPILVM